MKVLSVVGNRPQFIKSAPLSVALREAGIEEIVLHTGQHYDRLLSQVFFDELELEPPNFSLDLRTADPESMRPPIESVLRENRPDWVLVYGDTNSTLAGALAASELGFPVAHVEAGLRSGDISMAVPGHIEVVGDVMADATRQLAPIARARSQVLERLELDPGSYVVATVHREANTAQPRLGRIAEGLSRLAGPVVFPVHPRTRKALEAEGLEPAVRTVEPLGYLDFAALASQARVIVTDSGGLQKEAYWYGVPCVTLRPSTEWVDTVEVGANELVDDDPDRLVEAVTRARMPKDRPQLYGDGHASERIAEALVRLPAS